MRKELDPFIAARLAPKAQPLPAAEIAPEQEPKTTFLIWLVVLIGVVFVAIIMMRSVYDPGPPVNKVVYQEFEFVQLPDHFWEFEWQQGDAIYHIPLRYNPLQLDNVTVTGDIDSRFGERPELYLAVDPSNKTDQQFVALGVGEMGLNLLKVFGVELRPSCTRNETAACWERPIMTCEMDVDKSIIVIREGPGPTVIQNYNCIIVQGEKLELLQAVDRLLFKFYGIMP